MPKTPLHPDFLLFDDETEEAPEHAARPTRSARPGSTDRQFGPEAFSDRVGVIRGDTGSLAVEKILRFQLEEDRFLGGIAEDVRHKLIDIIVELMIKGKYAAETGMPVDFNIRFRELVAEENARLVSKKLLLLPRLASWLAQPKSFTLKMGSRAVLWKIERCSKEDLDSLGPKVIACNTESDQRDQIWLYHVMAGLKL